MRIQIRASTDTEVDSHPQIEPQKIDFSLVKQPQELEKKRIRIILSTHSYWAEKVWL